MAKVRLDALEAQKQGSDGESLAENRARDGAAALIEEAKGALPGGVPATSPYFGLGRDALMSSAAQLDMRFGPFMTDDDLRLVCEFARNKILTVGRPEPQLPMPSAPHSPVATSRVRHIKHSPTNTWRVVDVANKPKDYSVGNGQMAKMHHGAVISLQHYELRTLQGLVTQGLKLVPIEDPEELDE